MNKNNKMFIFLIIIMLFILYFKSEYIKIDTKNDFVSNNKDDTYVLVNKYLINPEGSEIIATHSELINLGYQFYKISIENKTDISYTLVVNNSKNIPNTEPTSIIIPPKDTINIFGQTPYLTDDNIYISSNDGSTLNVYIKMELSNKKFN